MNLHALFYNEAEDQCFSAVLTKGRITAIPPRFLPIFLSASLSLLGLLLLTHWV